MLEGQDFNGLYLKKLVTASGMFGNDVHTFGVYRRHIKAFQIDSTQMLLDKHITDVYVCLRV